jgi:hypothetical protein
MNVQVAVRRLWLPRMRQQLGSLKRWGRPLRALALTAAAVYVVFLAAMFVVMCQPPQRFGQIMKYFPMPAMSILPFEPMWNVARGGPTRVGDMAPDFDLPTVDHKTRVTLSSFRGTRPVVLVFGSYT